MIIEIIYILLQLINNLLKRRNLKNFRMVGRRAVTEGQLYDYDSDEDAIDLN